MADLTQQAAQQLAQQMTAMTAALAQMTTGFQNMVAMQGRTQAAQDANKKRLEDINDSLILFEQNLVKGKKLTDDQLKQVEKAKELYKEELRLKDELIKATQHEVDVKTSAANDADRIAKATRAREAKQAALTNVSAARREAENTASKSISDFTVKTDLAGAALVWFGSTLNTAARTVLAQNKANGGLIEGSNGLISALASQQNEALKAHVDPVAFANITTGARQMFNAMGGTSKGLEQFGESTKRFTIMTNSFEEGLKLSVEVAQNFANKGIRPTAQAMELYQNDLVTLRRQTGLSIDQVNAMYNEVASDADSIDLLRKARAGERESILASQRAMISQSIAAGMSAEQAKEAAKMLNKMVAAKPLDRIKQAARMRAIGGAYGVDATEASQGVLAGSRATDSQKAAIAQFGTNIANLNDSAAQNGMAMEIFTSTLTDKLNLDQYYGKGSVYSTTLGDSLKNANGDLAKAYIDVSKASTARMLEGIAGLWTQLGLIISGQHWLGVIASGVAAIAAMMFKDQILGMASKIGGKLGLGKGGSSILDAGNIAEGAAGEAGNIGKVSSKLVKGAKVLGPLAAIGLGAYEGYDEYQQTGKAGRSVGKGVGSAAGGIGGAWGGAAAGAAIGSVVPVVGTVIGGLIGAALGGYLGSEGGGAAGKFIGSQFDSPDAAALPLKAQQPKVANDQKDAKDASDTMIDATTATADGISQQVKQLDASNSLLQQIVALQQRATDLAEKQIVATTLTDKEKGDASNRSTLRKDNKFASTYNYA